MIYENGWNFPAERWQVKQRWPAKYQERFKPRPELIYHRNKGGVGGWRGVESGMCVSQSFRQRGASVGHTNLLRQEGVLRLLTTEGWKTNTLERCSWFINTKHSNDPRKWFSILTEKKKTTTRFCLVLFCIQYIYRWKLLCLQFWLKALCSHWAPRRFGFIQSWPWLLDWTHWLKGNFNDLLSQVLIRCWQTALCGSAELMARMDMTCWIPATGTELQMCRLTCFPLERSLCMASSFLLDALLPFFLFLTHSFSPAVSTVPVLKF